MKVLLTGAEGQVGSEIQRLMASSEGSLHACGRAQLDIVDATQVARQLTEYQPDLVINAAAYTAVDLAESEQDIAFSVNRDGPRNLATECARYHIPLIHLSTDYVFDGTMTRPYTEQDPVSPLGVYGQSKWQGEQQVRLLCEKHIILRVSWVYGCVGKNFVKTMLQLAKERDELRVVADQSGCPTSACDIARVIGCIVQKITDPQSMTHWGTYHYCGAPVTDWHQFASAIITEGRKYHSLQTKNIIAINTEDYPTAARRPEYSALCCDKILEHFGIQQVDWQSELQYVLKGLQL